MWFVICQQQGGGSHGFTQGRFTAMLNQGNEFGALPFNGEARFKFALVDSVRNAYHWTNDGAPGVPESGVLLTVDQGIFSVLLGQSPMVPIVPHDLGEFLEHQALRIWVDTGSGYVLLGDQPISTHSVAARTTGPFQEGTTQEGAV